MKDNLEQKFLAIQAKCQRLEQENQQLKQLLKQHQIPFHFNNKNNNRYKNEINRRVNLFNDLFKGRNDVYAIRWEAKNGKVGYSPAIKKNGNGREGDYLPLTSQTIYNHLICLI